MAKSVILNKQSLPMNYERKTSASMNYERKTSASIEPPLSAHQICQALLDPSEFSSCEREREEIIIKGHAFPAESPKINKDIISVIKPECLENGEVTLRDVRSFSFARARSYIQRKFGLSGFSTVGSRTRIVAFEVSSFVSYVEPEAHVKRYANILRAIKQKYPHVHFPNSHCQTTADCDPRLTQLLSDLLSEKNPIDKEMPQQ